MSSAAEHSHGPALAWPVDAHYGTAAPGKIGMWVFLISDAFSFGALLIAYGILRAEQPGWIRPGEPPLGVSFTAGLTLLLILTSVTNVLAYSAAHEQRRRQTALLLGLTALGGAIFLAGQYQEWFGWAGRGLVHEGLVFGHSARASTFYVITGYHGLHVLVGVVYILATLVQVVRGKAGAHQIEILGLYWCFVDFVWIFVFSLVYLMP